VCGTSLLSWQKPDGREPTEEQKQSKLKKLEELAERSDDDPVAAQEDRERMQRRSVM